MIRITAAVLFVLAALVAGFGAWGPSADAGFWDARRWRTPSIEPSRSPTRVVPLATAPHATPVEPTPVSQSSSCEYPDTNPDLYRPWLPVDHVLRLTAKNTVSLGTYVPDDLVELGSAYAIRTGERGSLRAEAAEAFRRMVEAAVADGITIRLVSGYRSCWTQRDLFAAYVAQYGLYEAGRFSARPGQSEHQLGLVGDISGPSVGYELTQDFGGTAEGTWLRWNAWNFGFVLSYPNGAESTTGYMYEPWHWRYVGSWQAARQFNASGLTLYEWLLTQGN
jgi:D-alanyl-D-alanine carboxypeptidase